jgi:hypothetical protein
MVFASTYEGRSSDEQVLALMTMLTQLSRFKSDVGKKENAYYLGSSAQPKALEEIIMWLSAAAAKQVNLRSQNGSS